MMIGVDTADLASVRFQLLAARNLRLHVAQCGEDSGRLLLLLHGFPEFWYGWRHQICFLAQHGFRVWAPDQRGYNLSDKPHGIRCYTIDELAKDVVNLIDVAGVTRASVVGHDWGAAVAWWAALRYPERIDKLVVMNVPHPTVMQRYLRTSLTQLRKSWYMFLFQLPWIPEAAASLCNYRPLIRGMKSTSRAGTFTLEDFAKYREAWSQPRALKCMVHWYRAALRMRPEPLASMRVTIPTLVIWGARDKVLSREMAQPSVELCDQGRLVFLEQATHWVQHEEAENVNRLLLDHLQLQPHR